MRMYQNEVFHKSFFRKLRIWSHFLKKSLMENFIFVQFVLKFALQHVLEHAPRKHPLQS